MNCMWAAFPVIKGSRSRPKFFLHQSLLPVQCSLCILLKITLKLLSYSQLSITSQLLTFILMLSWMELSVFKVIISYADEQPEEQFHCCTSERIWLLSVTWNNRISAVACWEVHASTGAVFPQQIPRNFPNLVLYTSKCYIQHLTAEFKVKF